MSTGPKRDERENIEMNEEELEHVSGGDGSVDPWVPVKPKARIELPKEDFETGD